MPALIRLLSGFLIVTTFFACAPGDEAPVFEPESDSEASEAGTPVRSKEYTIRIPEEFTCETSDSAASVRRYSELSEDRFVEIHSVPKVRGEGSEGITLEQFARTRLVPFKNQSSVIRETKLAAQDIHSLQARTIAFDVKRFGNALEQSYWMAFLEGEERFYEIRIWTARERKSYFEQEANAIIFSFREHGQ